MMDTIASKLLRKRVALVVTIGVAVMIFASVVDEIRGDLSWPEEQGRRHLLEYYGSWTMLQKDIKATKSKKKFSSAKLGEASESLKTVTEEFKVTARRVRNENIESGLKVSQHYEDEVESLRRKYDKDEEHTSDLLHEFYDYKKFFDTNFDAAKEVHDYERDVVLGEVEGRLNKSHQEREGAESKLNEEEEKYDIMLKAKKRGKRVVDKAYRKEKLKRNRAKLSKEKAARIKARKDARNKA